MTDDSLIRTTIQTHFDGMALLDALSLLRIEGQGTICTKPFRVEGPAQ